MSTPSAILVVEDDPAVSRLYRRALEHQGHQVHQAVNAAQARDLLKTQPPDLVLLDLHLPGGTDGEDLLFELRDRGVQVPVIVISGWVDDSQVAEHPDCVYAVLKKPLELDAFVNVVAEALS